MTESTSCALPETNSTKLEIVYSVVSRYRLCGYLFFSQVEVGASWRARHFLLDPTHFSYLPRMAYIFLCPPALTAIPTYSHLFLNLPKLCQIFQRPMCVSEKETCGVCEACGACGACGIYRTADTNKKCVQAGSSKTPNSLPPRMPLAISCRGVNIWNHTDPHDQWKRVTWQVFV